MTYTPATTSPVKVVPGGPVTSFDTTIYICADLTEGECERRYGFDSFTFLYVRFRNGGVTSICVWCSRRCAFRSVAQGFVEQARAFGTGDELRDWLATLYFMGAIPLVED